MNTKVIPNEEDEVTKWVQRIDEAEAREKKWRENAKEATKIYESEDVNKIPYNILYANTDILSTAIYSNPPVPRVKRRFDDEDPLGRVSSEVATRVLKYLIDPDNPNYSSVDTVIASAVREGLVTDRGCSRIKYDAEIENEDGEGEELEYETVCPEEVPYNRMCHAYAKEWSKVNWVAYTHYKTKEEVLKMLGKENIVLLESIPFTFTDEAVKDENEKSSVSDNDSVELAKLYEIWDKVNKKVMIIAAGYTDKFLSKIDDPYDLTGFYPSPRPIGFYNKISGLIPQPIYMVYKNQAEELNKITGRINKITSALKVRGFYDASVPQISQLVTADDNVLIAADNVLKLEGKALDNLLWFMPLQDLVNVLNQLYINRKEVKAIIFEITGIADIMRGSSVASETLGAQNLKSQWGTMRLKQMQKEGMRYARDFLRIMCELAFYKLSQDTIIKMCNLPEIMTNDQKQSMSMELVQLQNQFRMAQEQASIQMMNAQQSGQEVDLSQFQQGLEQLQGQIGTMQTKLQEASWEDIIEFLKDDMLRKYRIDIETNSTIEVDAIEDKKDIAEFMNSFSQYLNGVSPMIQEGLISFEASKAIIMAIVRKYKFGEEIEKELDSMQPPPPRTDPSQEALAQKAQLESQKLQQDIQAKQEEASIRLQIAQAELALKQQSMMIEEERSKREIELSQAEHTLKLFEIRSKEDLQNKKFALDLKRLDQQDTLKDMQHEMAMKRASKNELQNIGE